MDLWQNTLFGWPTRITDFECLPVEQGLIPGMRCWLPQFSHLAIIHRSRCRHWAAVPHDQNNILLCSDIFPAWRQISCVVGLIFYWTPRKQSPVSSLQFFLIWMATCIAWCVFWSVVILKYLLCLSAVFSCPLSIWIHSRSRFFQPTSCMAATPWLKHRWGGLTQTELADWQQRHRNTNTNLKLTQTGSRLYTAYSTRRAAAAAASTMTDHLLPQPPLMTTPCTRIVIYHISIFQRNCQIRAALTFQCRHRRPFLLPTKNLSTNARLVRMSLKDRLVTYVLSCIITSKIIRMTICVVIPGLPEWAPAASSITWSKIVLQ